MIERKSTTKTPREHFMRAAEDELAKFRFDCDCLSPAQIGQWSEIARGKSKRPGVQVKQMHRLYLAITFVGVTAIVFVGLIMLQRVIDS